MGRKKKKMELVEDERARATTYRRRVTGLKKMAYELSVLCNAKVCMFIIEPKFFKGPTKVETWPSDPVAVKNVIETYKASTHRQTKNFGLRDYFDSRIKKVDDEIAHVREANLKAKFPTWDDRINYFSPDQLESLVMKLNVRLDAANRRLDAAKRKLKTIPKPSDLVPADFPPEYPNHSNVLPKTLNPFNCFQAFPQQNLHYGLVMKQEQEQHSDDNQIQSQVPLKSTQNPFNHFQAFLQNNLEYGRPFMEQPSTSAKPPTIQGSSLSLSPADETLLKLSLGLSPKKNWTSPIGNPLTTMSMMNNLDYNFSSTVQSQSAGMASTSSSSYTPNNVRYSTPSPSAYISHHYQGIGLPTSSSIGVAYRDPFLTAMQMQMRMQNNVMLKQPIARSSYQAAAGFSPLSMQSESGHQAATNYNLQLGQGVGVMPPKLDFDQIDRLPEFQAVYRNIDEDEFAELARKNSARKNNAGPRHG